MREGQPGHEATYQLYYVVNFLRFGLKDIPMLYRTIIDIIT